MAFAHLPERQQERLARLCEMTHMRFAQDLATAPSVEGSSTPGEWQALQHPDEEGDRCDDDVCTVFEGVRADAETAIRQPDVCETLERKIQPAFDAAASSNPVPTFRIPLPLTHNVLVSLTAQTLSVLWDAWRLEYPTVQHALAATVGNDGIPG